MKWNAACDSHVSCRAETGRVFTWGRGNYGQLGRHASTSQSSESQSTTDGENLEACLPAEVTALRGATQVRYSRCNFIILFFELRWPHLQPRKYTVGPAGGSRHPQMQPRSFASACRDFRESAVHTCTHSVRALLSHEVTCV